MLTQLTLAFCRVIDLIQSCVEDDGKTQRLMTIAFTVALIALCLLPSQG